MSCADGERILFSNSFAGFVQSFYRAPGVSQQRPKKQHYVPQLHLRNFADAAGMIWAYDFVQERISPADPKEVAVESNFYSIQDEDGRYQDDLEYWLCDVESKAMDGYNALLEGEIPKGQTRANFAAFIASLYARTPAMLRVNAEFRANMMQLVRQTWLAKEQRRTRMFREVEKRIGKQIPEEDREKLVEILRDPDAYEVHVDRRSSLPAIQLSDRIQGVLFEMKWAVLGASGKGRDYFITSDNPVVRATPPQIYHPVFGDQGFLNPLVKVTVPLSPTRCLHISWQAEASGILTAPRDEIRTLNRARSYFAERFLFADRRESALMMLGQKYKDQGLKIEISSGAGRFSRVRVKRRLSPEG